MSFALTDLAQLDDLPFDSIIDVRAPAEFAEDHIPGALNLPVLDDAERARVGTIYVQDSPFRARKIGAALVARNAARHLEERLMGHDGGWRPLVCCWRGGQRSGAFTSILVQVGWRAERLEGGYRAYRRLVKQLLYDQPFPAPLVLLDGNTGTAKTDLLALLARRGVQVIDLETLANHRGSLFGARPGGQPTQKAFESALAQAIRRLDPARPVLVEAESSRIGARVIPPGLWRAMQAAPRLEIRAPLAARARYLARAYGDVGDDPARLAATIDRLAPYQPAERIAHWHALARAGQLEQLAGELMAHHYDGRYAKGRARAGQPVALATDTLDPAALERLADAIASQLPGMAAGMQTAPPG